jgi:hypothetical protein
MALSLTAIIVVLYGVYPPSFGNDTWRDAIQATQIIERGGLRDLTIVHEAYPLPVVSILYAVYSMVGRLSTLWSSSIIGLTYLMLLALWTQVLAKYIGTERPHVASLLTLTTPLAVLWSVCFIPQAYSLLMALPLLFLDLNPIIIVILAVALVLGHGAVALWTIAVLALLTIVKWALRARSQAFKSIEAKLTITLSLSALYTLHTTLSAVLRRGLPSAIEVLQIFLKEEKILVATPPIQVPPIAVLALVPVAVLVVLGFVALVEERNAMAWLLAFVSLAGLGVAYIGAVTYPALALPRYLGLQSTVVLAVLSPRALRALRRRGRAGSLYAILLLLLAITSFGFAGTLMPENPYTANSYTAWSIYGLVTYGEARELKDVAPLLCCNNYLVDWRASAYIAYERLWVQPLYRGFYDPKTNSTFTFAGFYGLVVTPEYFRSFNEIPIFRSSALHMPEAYSPQLVSLLSDELSKTAILYASPHIKLALSST